MRERMAMQLGERFDIKYETMPWHHCDSVVFDIGGILIYYAPDEFVKKIFPDDLALQDHMLQHVYRGKYWPMFDRGTMEYEEAAEKLSREFGYPAKEYMRAMTEWFELKSPIEEGWRAVSRCKRSGMRLFLLSNYPERGFQRLLERFDERFRIFDGGVISCKVHLLKPEPGIYRLLTDRYSLDPRRTLFIDDIEENVNAATREGIHGFHKTKQGAMDTFFV